MRIPMVAMLLLALAPPVSASCLSRAEYYAAEAEAVTSSSNYRAADAELSQAYVMLHQAGASCNGAPSTPDMGKPSSNSTPGFALLFSIIALATIAIVVRSRAKQG